MHELLKVRLSYRGNWIFIDGQLDDKLIKGIKNKFTYELPNAKYILKNNPNAHIKICFYNEKKKMLPIALRRGLIKTLQDYADHMKKELYLEQDDYRRFDETQVYVPDELIDVTLRDYQEGVIQNWMTEKFGILEIATGGGKTLIAAEIIRRLGMKTLFVVNRIELLLQTQRVFQSALGVPIGIIGKGKDDIENITVATVQSLLSTWPKYEEYLSTVRFLIVDECHNAGANSYLRLVARMPNTEYRLGLSGTAFRTDKTDLKMNAVVGYKIHEISAKRLIDMGFLFKPKIVFIKDYMNNSDKNIALVLASDGAINPTENYLDYYKAYISENAVRNQAVRQLSERHKGQKILVLTKLVEHGKVLAELIGGKHLYGDTPLEERKKLMKDFRDGDENIIVGTMSIFGEGVDLPALNVVINASANRTDVKSIQSLGRVLRMFDSKKEAVYYDFVDEHRFFHIASLARKRIFSKQGHYVQVEQLEENQKV